MRQKIDYIAASLVLCLAYFVVFLGLYAGWRQIDGDVVVFYDGIKAIIVTTILFAILSRWLMKGLAGCSCWLAAGSRFETQFTAIACFVLLSYGFVVTFPTIIDRSISVYVISTVAQAGPDGIGIDGIQDNFMRGYIDGTSTVEKRIHEQLISGNIIETNGRYTVTKKGEFFYHFHIAIAKIFNTSRKYVYATNLKPGN